MGCLDRCGGDDRINTVLGCTLRVSNYTEAYRKEIFFTVYQKNGRRSASIIYNTKYKRIIHAIVHAILQSLPQGIMIIGCVLKVT